jgi:hypothetical protein
VHNKEHGTAHTYFLVGLFLDEVVGDFADAVGRRLADAVHGRVPGLAEVVRAFNQGRRLDLVHVVPVVALENQAVQHRLRVNLRSEAAHS